jgi:hypothetical protein
MLSEAGPHRPFGPMEEGFASQHAEDRTGRVGSREPARGAIKTPLEVMPKQARMEGPGLAMIPDLQRDEGDAVGTGRVEKVGRRLSVPRQPGEDGRRDRSLREIVVLREPVRLVQRCAASRD